MTRSRHLLDLDGADRSTIERFVARAAEFKRGVPSAARLLHGRIVIGMFFEASTRTALSFAAAAFRLGAHWLDFNTGASSLGKGESLEDTMRTVRAIGADAIVVRHSESGFPHSLAPHFGGSIINAGDGCHAHPTQGLLDALTLQQEFGTLDGRRLTISGDIKHSRVARSSGRAASLLGAQVTLCGPPSSLPPDRPAWGFAAAASDLDAELPHSDAIMLLRVQKERIDAAGSAPSSDLSGGFGLDAKRYALLPAHAIIMHPGPVNRGVEIAASLVTDARSRIERQVENGTFMRMAVLEACIGGQS
ncbi:MAG TPA: aspartate carbamoyltransferase catalytic subunit [Candidatus Eremiobacteraceae bacterium]|nr:aspartate carbamoyltransferase catalytic subunit [Candidatus Eremiobacteraceae bacterium]